MRSLLAAIRDVLARLSRGMLSAADWALDTSFDIVSWPVRKLCNAFSGRDWAPQTGGGQQQALAQQQQAAMAAARQGTDQQTDARAEALEEAVQLRRVARKLLRGGDITPQDLAGISEGAGLWLQELTTDQRQLVAASKPNEIVAHLASTSHIEGLPTVRQALTSREQRLAATEAAERAQFEQLRAPRPVIASDCGFAERLRAKRANKDEELDLAPRNARFA